MIVIVIIPVAITIEVIRVVVGVVVVVVVIGIAIVSTIITFLMPPQGMTAATRPAGIELGHLHGICRMIPQE